MADKKISGTHRPHRLTSQEHYSDAFLTSAFLALSGGLQDAYTYNTRDGVFSNAQTGNVVLMSQHLMRGENTLETAHSVDRDRDFVCSGFHSAAV